MKRFATVIVLLVLSVSILVAGTPNKNVGTKTSIATVDGRVVQKIETIAEPNPLPPVQSILEQERSKPIPNTRLYNSGIRWQSNDGAAIAQDVAVNTNGTNPFVGWYLNNKRVSFHDNFSSTPLWEFPSDPQMPGRNFVSVSATANIIANGSYHNIYLFNKSTGAVTFNFPIPNSRTAGPIAVSRDGQLLVCATASPLSGGIHRVYAFNPPSTTPIWTFDFSDGQSSGLYGINININKTVVAVNGKFYGWILNAADGTVRTQFEINNTESRIALSADASVMAIAELSGFVKALAYSTAQSRYNLLWMYKIPPGAFTNWASAVEVSADGLTIMAGSLVFLTAGYDGSLYMFDTFGEGSPLWIKNNLGDEVGMVALSDDGSLAAAATWADAGNTQPAILIFERNSNVPVYTVTSPGSMFSIAMSGDGKTVVAGGKHVHARTFGSGGDVYNIAVDLGGGAVAGTITLGGAPPNHSGTIVQVVGTNRSATTLPNGQYLVTNVPPGIYSLRATHLGYVGTTLNGVAVTGTDTTRNINATLALTGAAPTNLVASHSQNSRIQLNWTNPTLADDRAFDRLRAVDDVVESPALSLSARNPRNARTQSPLYRYSNQSALYDLVPPDSIRIYRSIRTGGPYYLKRTVAGAQSTYLDSSAMPLKDYYYRVTAIYGNGESAYSNEAYGTVDSSFLQFTFTTPHRTATTTIDGTLSPGEWTDAVKIDVSDVFGNGGGVQLPRGSTFMYFKYDSVAKKLYVAGEDFLNTDGLANSEGFGLYVDDNNNNQFEPQGTDPLLREGNYWAYFFSSGSTVRFREIYTNGGVNAVVDTVTDAQITFSSATGHIVGEISIPISFFDKNHLRVFGPDKIIGGGFFMIGRTTSGSAIYHGWWPQTMVSVFTPSGFGEMRIPVRLLAAPKAPSNIQATRQGSRLRVTWTDPTQGINNDPLTVPATLQLWRNGTLWREFATGVQGWTDSNVVAQGWYEYRMRGYINVDNPLTNYFGPYSIPIGAFAVSDPQLTELKYDDGIPEAFYVVDFTYNDNKFGIRFTPQQYPTRVYRVKAFTNNGNSPILVSIHSDSLGFPGAKKAGPYLVQSNQTSGIDSFIVTIPADEPPAFGFGDFQVVLSYLPTSPGAPGIGGDLTLPIDMRSTFYTSTQGWQSLSNADLIVRASLTGQTQAVNQGDGLPSEYSLAQNYPNPFNPATKIRYQLAAKSVVSLKVFDVLGREVATLVNDEKEPGTYSVLWNARNAASGVYFYQLQAGSFTEVKKLILMK